MTYYAETIGPLALSDGTYIMRVVQERDDGRMVRFSVTGDTPDECRERLALMQMDKDEVRPRLLVMHTK